MASSDNQLSIPARSVLDIGARYRFHIGRAPATLRLYFGNVFDTFGWRTNASEVFVVNGPRRFSLSIAADFPGGE
jgi:iron complex outermembrane receptor protein